MAYFLFKCWREKLYTVTLEGVIPWKSTLAVDMVPVTEENAHLVCRLRGKEYEPQFRAQLAMGDFGYYACVGGEPVGYGWAKHSGSDDYFFCVGDGCVYLCRFFVHEAARGCGVYPALITELIERETGAERFYIAAERGNEASISGLSKVGFTFTKEYGFVRGFKHTFNKKYLSKG